MIHEEFTIQLNTPPQKKPIRGSPDSRGDANRYVEMYQEMKTKMQRISTHQKGLTVLNKLSTRESTSGSTGEPEESYSGQSPLLTVRCKPSCQQSETNGLNPRVRPSCKKGQEILLKKIPKLHFGAIIIIISSP